MAVEAVVKAVCPKCGPRINSDTKGRFSHTSNSGDVTFWSDHYILQCRGCESVFFERRSSFSEEWEHRVDPDTGEAVLHFPERVEYWPPLAKRARPDWLLPLWAEDDILGSILADIYKALDSDLGLFAAIGGRTAFDRASELLGIDPNRPFAQKLDALVQAGAIGHSEKDVLTVLVESGSAAAHRGWRPVAGDLDTIMHVLESFLHRTFVLKKQAASLRSAVPPRGQLAKPDGA